MIIISNPNILNKVISLTKNNSDNKICVFGDWTDDQQYQDDLRKNNIKVLSISHSKNSAANFARFERTYNDELVAFINKLNLVHKKSSNSRNWEMLIGPYLKTVIYTILSRERLVYDLKLEKEVIFYSNHLSIEEHIPYHYQDFTKLLYSHEWNSLIYSLIFKKLGYKVVYIKNNNDREKKAEPIIRKNIFLFYYRKLFFLNKRKNLIIDLGFNSFIEKIIKILTLNFYVYRNDKESYELCNERKQKIFELFELPTDKDHQNIFNISYIFMPILYVENYIISIQKTPFPKKVKNIYSSTSHFINDKLKIWLSEYYNNTDNNLFIFQHGGAFGFTRFNSHIEAIENNICDYRLTWGWSNKNDNKIKEFISCKLLFRSRIFLKNNKIIILFCTRRKSYERGEAWDSPFWNNLYTKNLISLTNSLKHINKFFVKLHPEQKKFGIDLKKDIHIKCNFENFIEHDNSDKILKYSLLNICTNNSTVFLESLKLNIPTILIFWDYKINPLYKERFKDIRDLMSVNIVFLDPDRAIKFINKIHLNVDRWWNKNDVQMKKNKFVSKYANTNLIKSLQKLKLN